MAAAPPPLPAQPPGPGPSPDPSPRRSPEPAPGPGPAPQTGPGFELGTDGPSAILVGFDDSDSSWRALHYAIGLARRQHSKIVAVYACPLPGLCYGATVVPTISDYLRPELAAMVQRIGREHDVEITFVSAPGDPAAVLTAAAADWHADLIVVGASTRAGHRLFGSIALRTVRARRFPVTVVP
jgi:nucleotide-binding universal stress UspA family protein